MGPTSDAFSVLLDICEDTNMNTQCSHCSSLGDDRPAHKADYEARFKELLVEIRPEFRYPSGPHDDCVVGHQEICQ